MQRRSNESPPTLDETNTGTTRKIRVPDRDPGLSLTRRVYRALKVFENRRDLEVRKLILAVLEEEFPELWGHRKVRAPRYNWERMAIELYLRTEILLPVDHIREIFNEAKEQLRAKLQYCQIRNLSLHETELHLNQWDLYQQIKFFREEMQKYDNIDVNVVNVFADEMLRDIPGDDGPPGFFNPVLPETGPFVYDSLIHGIDVRFNDEEEAFDMDMDPQNEDTMVRRSSRFNSSEGAGTSSPGKKKEKKKEKKPIAVKKVSSTKKTAIAKPSKLAPKAPKATPPRAHYTAADVQRLKAELEKCLLEEAAQQERKEKLVAEQTKKIEELEQLDQAKMEKDGDTDERFAIEEGEAREKKKALEKKSKKFEEKVVVQKKLQQTRALSTHFQKRCEALEKRQANVGAARSYQQCELCHVPWSQVGDSVPRVLNCGHTMCDKCTKKFAIEDNYIKCPFDEEKTYGGGTIPKNYTLLNM